MVKVAVIGAGIVGLSTAVCLQNEIQDAEVTVISDLWYNDTTSDGAAGIFRPDHVAAANPADIPKWIGSSAARYWGLYASRDAPAAGIFQLGGYLLSNDDPDLPEAEQYRDFLPNYRRLAGRELDKYGGPWRYGSYLSTLVVEPRIYMRYLEQEFEKRAGVFLKTKITNLRDLYGQFDLVVNCTGLGARSLVNDESVVPVRGQLVRVKAPWLKEFCMGERITYIYPNSQTVVLGGTRDTGQWDVTVSSEETRNIISRCSRMIPALCDAEVLNEWVGLRPWRPTIRLESEHLQLERDRTLPVIHNYGHGGNGIALSWGCGLHAASLAKKLLLSMH